MSPNEPTPPGAPASGSAVFVDSSGQRATRIRHVAALLVLVCLAYGAALLIAALTGVPIRGAIVPYPALGSTTHATHPAKAPQHAPSGSTTGVSSKATGTPVLGVATASSTPRPPSATKTAHTKHSPQPTASVTPSAGATTPAATPTKPRGKSSTAPGASNRPTSHPTKTATAHGHHGKG